MQLLMLTSLLFAPLALANFELVVDRSNFQRPLSNAEELRLQNYLAEVKDLLPQSLKDSLNKTIEVSFTALNSDSYTSIAPIECSSTQLESQGRILGRVPFNLPRFITNLSRLRKIELDRSVLGTVISGDDHTFSCGHGSTYQLAQAVLIHEVAHLYDWSNTRLGPEAQTQSYCEGYTDEQLETLHYCRSFLQSRRAISKSPYFLNISGWVNHGLVFTRRVNHNHLGVRSPDPYEFSNPEETFAVNMEFYLLDRDYPCRRPTLTRYFDSVFGLNKYDTRSCRPNQIISVQNRASAHKVPLSYASLDPRRVYQVHYLFAGKGPQMMSRWGHSMFRLVMCREDQEPGPDCLRDIRNDIVISYRANVEDPMINYMDGVRGTYDSQAFLQSMSDILHEYNVGEFRDVISLPIKMSRKQTELFVERALENYWSYRGSYYFLTNNCATESMNLLKSAFYDDIAFQARRVLHPLGMYRQLDRAGLIDRSLIEQNPQRARELGKFFPGHDERIARSYEVLVEANPALRRTSFRDYAIELTPEQRREVMGKLIESSSDRRSAIAHSLRLENQVLDSFEKRLATKVGERLFGRESNSHNDGISESLRQRLEEIQESLKSMMAEYSVTTGYGIPLDGELRAFDEVELIQKGEEFARFGESIREDLLALFPHELTEFEGILENRLWIVQQFSSP